ncbi:MAG: LPS assembly lipoprotein LptE [Deltaproteobacteria bacterium]|nr:LPS assembly lipoprotein LptE [Deltaproteobacteria bacterium]
MIFRKNIVILAALFFIAGCGYGPASVKPEPLGAGIRSVAVPVFGNMTFRAGIEGILSTRVADELVNMIKVTDTENADARLDGVITHYRLTPVAFTENSVVSEYRLTVSASVRLVKKGETASLWDEAFEDFEDFKVDTSNVTATRENETEAFREIAHKMARLIRERFSVRF